MTIFNEGRYAIRALGAAVAATAGRAKNCFAQGLTRSEGAPLTIITGSPDRRIAGSPDRRIAGSLVFTALLLISSPVYAETVTLECPSSVVEGGLVAQATNCLDPNLPIGRPYCEYRDFPGIAINARSTDPTSAGLVRTVVMSSSLKFSMLMVGCAAIR